MNNLHLLRSITLMNQYGYLSLGEYIGLQQTVIEIINTKGIEDENHN